MMRSSEKQMSEEKKSTPDEDYVDLIQAVDTASSELSVRFASEVTCKRGCHQCCLPNLTVSEIERQHIRQHLASDPHKTSQLLDLEQADPHRGLRCSFLHQDGGCGIYTARPIMCRSHGLPILFEEGGDWFADVCELNFTDSGLAGLEEDDFLAIDLINVHLANINISAGFSDQRTSLRASAILEHE